MPIAQPIIYHMAGADPFGGHTRLVGCLRPLVEGEIVYCNNNWYRVARAGLQIGVAATDPSHVAFLVKLEPPTL